MTPRTIYIASPDTEQGLALARLLGAAGDLRLRGALLPGESSRRTPLTCVDMAEALADPAGQVLPTGIRSTSHVLDRGPADLGVTTFSGDSLRTGDKAMMLELVKTVGVPIPRTWTDREVVPDSVERVFYKESHEQGGGRRGVLEAGSDLGNGQNLIFQEYVDSSGTYGVAFIAHQGTVLEHQAHFERFSSPWTGGSAVLIEAIDDPQLLHFTEAIVSALDYSGWGLAEFKWSPERGEYVFMEVNSKLWASCEFTFRSNPNFLELVIQARIDPGTKPRAMLFVHRLLALSAFNIMRTLGHAIRGRWVIYPGALRSFILARLPRGAATLLRSRIKSR